jgi:hypothetical protein
VAIRPEIAALIQEVSYELWRGIPDVVSHVTLNNVRYYCHMYPMNIVLPFLCDGKSIPRLPITQVQEILRPTLFSKSLYHLRSGGTSVVVAALLDFPYQVQEYPAWFVLGTGTADPGRKFLYMALNVLLSTLFTAEASALGIKLFRDPVGKLWLSLPKSEPIHVELPTVLQANTITD